jgi:hypothetical protein
MYLKYLLYISQIYVNVRIKIFCRSKKNEKVKTFQLKFARWQSCRSHVRVYSRLGGWGVIGWVDFRQKFVFEWEYPWLPWYSLVQWYWYSSHFYVKVQKKFFVKWPFPERSCFSGSSTIYSCKIFFKIWGLRVSKDAEFDVDFKNMSLPKWINAHK